MQFALWLVALSIAGCGGKYIEPGSEGAGATDSVSDPTSSAAAGSGAGSSSTRGGSYANPSLPKHDLGVCTPGFDHVSNPGRACPWLTEAGQCFASNDAACACACPTDRDSVCYSGFEDPGTPTLVHCQ